MSKETVTFYYEWLPLDKKEFRILAMLADRGEYHGTLSPLCDYFSVSCQTRNRDRLRNSIQELKANGFIEAELNGWTYTLRAVPKAQRIEMDRGLFESIKSRNYATAGVAWEQVLKLYLWIVQHESQEIVTNREIAEALNTSESTVCAAKNVLQYEYEAIAKHRVSAKYGDSFRSLGQIIEASAWWNTAG